MKLYPPYVRSRTVYTLPGLVSHFVEDPHSLLSPLVRLLQPLFMCPPPHNDVGMVVGMNTYLRRSIKVLSSKPVINQRL